MWEYKLVILSNVIILLTISKDLLFLYLLTAKIRVMRGID